MDQEIREMLRAVDDPVHSDNPPGFNRSSALERVAAAQKELDLATNHTFELFLNVQEITYFAELTTRYSSNDFDFIFVQFSYFGNLFTIYTRSDSSGIPRDLVKTIIDIITSKGFVYVRSEVLDIPYTGNNRDFKRGTWRNRFFGTWDEL